MRANDRVRREFVRAIDELNLGGPYFVEKRITRHRGPFLRAVKDVEPGQSWWELRYFFSLDDVDNLCWAYLPEKRDTPEFAWGYTIEQAYLNGIFRHSHAQAS